MFELTIGQVFGVACASIFVFTRNFAVSAENCNEGTLDLNTLSLTIQTDFVGFDFLSWDIVDSNGTTLMHTDEAGAGFDPFTSKTESICVDFGCYTIIIGDSYGDGLCCDAGEGWYDILFNNKSIVDGPSTFYKWGVAIEFCNDELMNITELDNAECNNISRTIEESQLQCLNNSNDININLVNFKASLDCFPIETTWNIVDHNGALVLNDKGQCHEKYDYVSETVCVPDGCFKLTVNDSWGDGFTGACGVDFSIEGFFELYFNHEPIVLFPKQTFIDSSSAFEWCYSKKFVIDVNNNYDNVNSLNELKIILTNPNPNKNISYQDFDIRLSILNVSEDVSDVLYRQTTDNFGDSRGDSMTFFLDEGCYLVTFAESENSGAFSYLYDNGIDSISLNSGAHKSHMFYKMTLNNETVAFGGYYGEYESNVICTNKTISIARCIIPHACNGQRFEDITHRVSIDVEHFVFGSYKSLTNGWIKTTNFGVTQVDCFGVYSCQNTYIAEKQNCYAAFSCYNVTFWYAPVCYATGSCMNANITYTEIKPIAYATKSSTSIVLDAPLGEEAWDGIVLEGSFVMMNGVIRVTKRSGIYLKGYYSLWNTTIEVEDGAQANVTCSDGPNGSPQWFTFKMSSAGTMSNINIHNCSENFYSYIIYDEIGVETIDSDEYSIIQDIISLLDQLFDIVENDKCPEKALEETFDIGYALYVDSIITRNDENVCCRASEACAAATSITATDGNVLCLGFESCFDCGLIITLEEGQNIFCSAFESCYGASLESANDILCSSPTSCETSLILGAKRLYCTMNACTKSITTRAEVVYFVDTQADAQIYSGGIGSSAAHFIGKNAASHVTYFCSTGDVCSIFCYAGACDSETTVVYCDGKCEITCRDADSSDDNNCVRIETSLAPTAAPTESSLYTEEELSSAFNWLILTLIGITFLAAIVGFVYANKHSQREMFSWQAVISVAFYCNDFVSDIFFCLKLYLLANDQSLKYTDVYLIFFIGSIVFLIVPLIANLIQLHLEVSKWTSDPILVKTTIPIWIRSGIKIVYLIAIISGSSFSAIELVNSFLFGWPIFSMGLPQYYRIMFQKKRFFSIVMLENVPQFLLQIATLYFSGEEEQPDSTILITIFSMIFTIISIMISGLEYILKSKFIKSGSVVVVQFELESSYIAKMDRGQFLKQIIYRKRKIVYAISRITNINSIQVDRLNPKHTSKGAIFTFFIDRANNEHYDNDVSFKDIQDRIEMSIKGGELAQEFIRIYKHKKYPLDILESSLTIKKLKGYAYADGQDGQVDSPSTLATYLDASVMSETGLSSPSRTKSMSDIDIASVHVGNK